MNLRLRFTHVLSAEGWIRSYEQKDERRSSDPPENKAEVPKSMDPGKARVKLALNLLGLQFLAKIPISFLVYVLLSGQLTLIGNGYPLVKSAKKAAGFSRTEETKGSRGHTHGLFVWLGSDTKGIKLQPSVPHCS